MSKQYIIPIFVPHLGCPNDCVFCNQRSISGQLKQMTKEETKATIEKFLASFKDEGVYTEIAFFGGSFTGIDIKKQKELLEVAYDYVKSGQVDGIRLSTRPDYISVEELKLLKQYGVTTIELGVQSTNDYILKKCKRGHSFDDVKKASKLIKKYKFNLGHQMMIGLPESTRLDELRTAKDLAKLKPKIIRLYPVLVIKNTELAKEYDEGIYKPVSLDKAVDICKELYIFFTKKKIKVIRMGLQNTDLISNPDNINSEVVAGPYHEAFGQLVEDSIWYDKIINKIKKFNTKVIDIVINANEENVNNIVGHHKQNITKIKDIYDINTRVKVDNQIKPEKFEIHIVKTYKDFLDD